jgi:hypothetical protein
MPKAARKGSRSESTGAREATLGAKTDTLKIESMSKLADCRLIALPKISEARGNLTFIESGRHVPFDCKRVYYTYDVPGGSDRGAHAHRQLHQCLIAVSGSFDVVLDDGSEKKRFHLNRPDTGLYVCPMVWRELDSFSSGSVCLVLASEFYDADDYYRDYSLFLKDVRAKRVRHGAPR